MTAWALVAISVALGGALLAWGRARLRAGATLEEALPTCAIGELEPGRFRLVGRVVPIETTPSAVDGVPCVYAERADYEMGVGLVPVLREVAHEAVAHPFFLEDASGRILVDPACALIDCGTAIGDAGLTAERRVRAGEEVALSASFARVDELDDLDGPYRASARRFRAVADETGPPRLSHRTEEGMVAPPPDEVTAFLAGAGALMMLIGGLLAFVLGFVV